MVEHFVEDRASPLAVGRPSGNAAGVLLHFIAGGTVVVVLLGPSGIPG